MNRTLFIVSIVANSDLVLSGEIREAYLLCVHRRHLVEGAGRVWSPMAAASLGLEPSNHMAQGYVDGQCPGTYRASLA